MTDTSSTNQVELLSDEVVAEIAKRPLFMVEMGRRYGRVLLTSQERDALCVTVKALRERERTLIAVNSELIEGNHAAHVALDAAGVKREDVAWEGLIQHVTEYPVCDRVRLLQSQLAALREENERLIKERDRAKEDVRILTKGRFIQS